MCDHKMILPVYEFGDDTDCFSDNNLNLDLRELQNVLINNPNSVFTFDGKKFLMIKNHDKNILWDL